MRRLNLDYVGAHPWSGGSLLLACGAALAAAALWQFQALERDRASVAAASITIPERAGAPQRSPARQRAEAAETARQAAQANAVIDRLSLPWGELFSTFELATSDEIALLAIEPDARKRAVKVSAEARTAKEMLDYIKRLQRAPLLEGVLLQKHELRTEDPERPLRFVVVATWKESK
jgi:hypothetical protein